MNLKRNKNNLSKFYSTENGQLGGNDVCQENRQGRNLTIENLRMAGYSNSTKHVRAVCVRYTLLSPIIRTVEQHNGIRTLELQGYIGHPWNEMIPTELTSA